MNKNKKLAGHFSISKTRLIRVVLESNDEDDRLLIIERPLCFVFFLFNLLMLVIIVFCTKINVNSQQKKRAQTEGAFYMQFGLSTFCV